MGISQPALSQGLNALEKEIGLKIFNRRAKPITTTPEGELYYQHICRIETLNRNFDKELDNYREQTNSRVVIGAPAVYVRSVIGPCVASLDRDYDVRIKTASVERLIKAAEAGTIDCFISTTDKLPEMFETQFIYQEEIVLCVPGDCKIPALDFNLLKEQCFICLEEQFPLQQAVDELMKENGFQPKRKIVIDQVSEAVNLVELGLGVCFASKEAAMNRNVRTIPTKLLGRRIYLAYDRELYRTKACDALIHAIVTR